MQGQGLPSPSAKALRDLRRRIGPAPLKALFEVLAGPVAQPSTPGVSFGRYRTVAFDGCTSIKVPDTSRNRSWLGKMKAALGVTGYPAVELMSLVETGTRAMLGATFGPPATGETDYARQLLPLLSGDMLVLADRGFDAAAFLGELAATGAQFLVRLRINRRLPVLARLDDGSFLSRIGELAVRIIAAHVTVTCADGTRYTASYRLVTTLTDHRRYPAPALISLYHERWEHEIAYLAPRHTLLNGRVLRSGDPAGLNQEIWALLALYQALRRAMVTAVESVPDTDPTAPASPPHCTPPSTPSPQPTASSPTTPPDQAASATQSSPRCCHPAAPASASARSNPPCPAGTRPTHTDPPAAPR